MAALDDYGIRYLVVGGIAVGFHAEPRYTKDLDLLIRVSAPGHRRLFDRLAKFGAPVSIMSGLQCTDTSKGGTSGAWGRWQ